MNLQTLNNGYVIAEDAVRDALYLFRSIDDPEVRCSTLAVVCRILCAEAPSLWQLKPEEQ